MRDPQPDEGSVYRLRDHGEFIRLYRIVLTDQPTVGDFRSAVAMGRRVHNPMLIRLADGLSFYATYAQARETSQRAAARGIVLGGFAAGVDIPTEGRYRIERTTRSQGHFTVWGAFDRLLAFVAEIAPLEWEIHHE